MLALLLFRFIWPGREFPMDYPNIWAVARLFLPGNDKDIGQGRGGRACVLIILMLPSKLRSIGL